MSFPFQLSCESTVDLSYDYISGRDISVIFYTYVVEGKEYVDDMGRNPNALPEFFEMLKQGKMPATSQINTFRYEEYFEELLKKGDVLHIAFGTGMTPSYRNAVDAAEILKEKYPERKLVVIDSLCSCFGYGILVDSAADMRDNGASLEEIKEWVLANRNKVHHQLFSTDLTQFKRSGRVSGPAATIGTVLGICPIMHLNSEGRIIAYSKARGKKAAIKTTVETIMEHIQNGKAYNDKFIIGHSNCLDLALETRDAFKEYFPNAEEMIKIDNIGTIISAHCGPGTIAIFFYGDERTDK
ncbi:MAG: DegV family protein [Clostridia bacterium]|nr:DegV family protein [Clostridia bacterium]